MCYYSHHYLMIFPICLHWEFKNYLVISDTVPCFNSRCSEVPLYKMKVATCVLSFEITCTCTCPHSAAKCPKVLVIKKKVPRYSNLQGNHVWYVVENHDIHVPPSPPFQWTKYTHESCAKFKTRNTTKS